MHCFIKQNNINENTDITVCRWTQFFCFQLYSVSECQLDNTYIVYRIETALIHIILCKALKSIHCNPTAKSDIHVCFPISESYKFPHNSREHTHTYTHTHAHTSTLIDFFRMTVFICDYFISMDAQSYSQRSSDAPNDE